MISIEASDSKVEFSFLYEVSMIESNVEDLEEIIPSLENELWLRKVWIRNLEYLDSSELAKVTIPMELEDVLIVAWERMMENSHSFFLKEACFSKSSALAFSKVLKNAEILREFSLSNSFIDDMTLKMIADAISENSSLKKFHFYSNKLGNEGFSFLMEAIKRNPMIKNINLSDNMLIDDEDSIFSEMFESAAAT